MAGDLLAPAGVRETLCPAPDMPEMFRLPITGLKVPALETVLAIDVFWA